MKAFRFFPLPVTMALLALPWTLFAQNNGGDSSASFAARGKESARTVLRSLF